MLFTDTVPLGWTALGGLPTVMMVTVPSVWLDTDRICLAGRGVSVVVVAASVVVEAAVVLTSVTSDDCGEGGGDDLTSDRVLGRDVLVACRGWAAGALGHVAHQLGHLGLQVGRVALGYLWR